ncbi:MAG TPA: tyrosine--tRNA ligase [Acidimicrobiia bacterium]|nr:tyrosine--tRNA ligase [Acidimicrobiia bacterium]
MTSESMGRLMRRTDQVLPPHELEARLAEGKPLRIKLGLDPTAPAVTLGWAVVLRKLRDFQEHGHTAVLIVGDFTARVGDPSLKSETRTRLSAAQVDEFAQQVLTQFEKVLLPEPLEVRYNSEWLGALDMSDVLELTSTGTVAQLLERGDFAKRFEAQTPISVMEFLYPFLQGYDSVAVEADVELGGSDQLWNLMMGRVVQERYGQRPQVAMTLPLLLGTDGSQKMSQSLGNYIGVTESASEMYGKTMSIPDDTMANWFPLVTELPEFEIDEILAGLANGTVHPRDAKRTLARRITATYHGEEAALAAEEEFDRVFRQGVLPDEIPMVALPTDDPINLASLLRDAGVVASAGEARRLITQGAVSADGQVVENEWVPRVDLEGIVLKIGKRRFLRLGGE